MNSNRGFTLIELLAVIVVLAIIAVIATPMVLNTIEEAKVGAAKSSVYSYIGEVETELVSYMLENNSNSYAKGKYNVEQLKKDLEISLKGSEPTEGNVCIGVNSSITSASLKINGYVVNYDGKTAVETDLEEIEDITCDGNDYTEGDDNTSDDDNNSEVEVVSGLATGTYNAGDSIAYAGVDWYVVSDNGDNVTLITKSNISQGYYGIPNSDTATWNTSNARTTVINWLNNNSELLAAQNNSLLVQDSSTGDYIRLPRSNELSTLIPNNSNSYFWTMTKDESSTDTVDYMILGTPQGNIGTYTIYTSNPGTYYTQKDYALDYVSTAMVKSSDITTGPVTNVAVNPGRVSDNITINMVTQVSANITGQWYSDHATTASSAGNYSVCHYTYGVSPNVPLKAGQSYAIGDISCTGNYDVYKVVPEYASEIVNNVGFRPIITVKEQ